MGESALRERLQELSARFHTGTLHVHSCESIVTCCHNLRGKTRSMTYQAITTLKLGELWFMGIKHETS